MSRSPGGRVAGSVLAAIGVLAVAAAPPVDPPYPLEIAPSYPGGLFHWVDCLAGTSVAKTIAAHRTDYARRFGPLAVDDREALASFAAMRRRHERQHEAGASSDLLGVFCDAATVEDAVAAASRAMDPASLAVLRAALDRFRPRYEVVWNGGETPARFLERATRDPKWSEVHAFLADMARFFGVDPSTAPPPRIALVPVPVGHGTHAQAVGRNLLIEIREGDTLSDQASVIVHEYAHFLFDLVPAARRRALSDAAARYGSRGERGWRLILEGLPTALGQGVADKMFRPSGWSTRKAWYHFGDVDAAAKSIYPLVNWALANDRAFDDEFVRAALLRMGLDAASERPGSALQPH